VEKLVIGDVILNDGQKIAIVVDSNPQIFGA